MRKVRNIFVIDVGRDTKNAQVQRAAFAVAKSIWDEASQRLRSSFIRKFLSYILPNKLILPFPV